jgi:hypothetical protein
MCAPAIVAQFPNIAFYDVTLCKWTNYTSDYFDTNNAANTDCIKIGLSLFTISGGYLTDTKFVTIQDYFLSCACGKYVYKELVTCRLLVSM